MHGGELAYKSRSTLAGAQLKSLRTGRRLTQMDLARPAGVSRPYISQFETGHKKLSEVRVATLNRLSRAIGLDQTEEQSLQAAIAADDICTALCDGDTEAARRLLWSPLREKETRLLRHALSKQPVVALPHPILSSQDRSRAIESLKSLVALAADSSERRDLTVRNQAVYHLSRSEEDGVDGLLTELAKSEREPVVRRSVAVGKALLADSRLLDTYVDRLRSDAQEQRLNLGYMGWYSGERRVRYLDAYSSSGEWTGAATLDWLLQDIRNTPVLSELNLLSIRVLLVDKGSTLLYSSPRRMNDLARALRQIDRDRDPPHAGLRDDIKALRAALHRAPALSIKSQGGGR